MALKWEILLSGIKQSYKESWQLLKKMAFQSYMWSQILTELLLKLSLPVRKSYLLILCFARAVISIRNYLRKIKLCLISIIRWNRISFYLKKKNIRLWRNGGQNITNSL